MYTNNSQGINLIQGLSHSWRSLFKDSEVLENSYEAAELSIEQAYLDILQDSLSVSVNSAPIWKKLLRRAHFLYEKDMVKVPRFSGGYDYAFKLELPDSGWSIKNIGFIGNSVIAPTAWLENGVDFSVVQAASTEYRALKGRYSLFSVSDDILLFNENPFDNIKFSKKFYDVQIPIYVSPIGPSVNYGGLGVVVGDRVVLTFDSSGAQYSLEIVGVETSLLSVRSADLNFIAESAVEELPNRGVRFSVQSVAGVVKVVEARGRFIEATVRDSVISVWFHDVAVDDYTLSQLYGELLGITETSTEGYKNLLRGLLQHFVRGQSVNRVTTAVHVIAGLPVFAEDGEIVEAITTTSALGGLVVQTDSNVYTTKESYPIRDKVLLAASSIDGNAPDGAARWCVFNDSTIDLYSLGIDSSYKIVISDGTSPGVSYTADILKVYNGKRLLIGAATPIPAGAATYFGYSVGDNSPAYDNRLTLTSDRSITISLFEQNTALEFVELETITDAVKVTDYIASPEWFHNKLMPDALIPKNESLARKYATPKLNAPKIGNKGVKIGDSFYKLDKDSVGGDTVVQLPYFDVDLTILPSAKLFRRDEYVFSYSGYGNGYGRVIYHDRNQNILYVKVHAGTFMEGDVIAGQDSNCIANIGYRSRVRISVSTTTTGLGLTTYTSTDGATGTAEGKVFTKSGPNELELFERPIGRLVAVNDIMTVGSVTFTVLSVHQEGIAKAHNSAAFYYMDNLWKYGVVYVQYDRTSFTFPRGLDNLRGRPLSDGIESRVMLYVDPFTRLIEFIDPPEESLALEFSRVFSEIMEGFDSNIKIDGPSAAFADPWKIGETGYVIGGANPAYDASNIESFAGTAFTDYAVQLTFFP